jgi:nucleoside 2-deoxyribosyltransferase
VKRPSIYLAGPDVFLPDAREIGRRKKALCAQYGFTGLFPFDNDSAVTAGSAVDRVIYEANVRMIRRADIGIFNLTPFRGPSAGGNRLHQLRQVVTGTGSRCHAQCRRRMARCGWQ